MLSSNLLFKPIYMRYLLLATLLFVAVGATAQQHEYFKLAEPTAATGSSYRYFLFQDLRDRQDDLGVVIVKKVFDYKATVLPRPALDSQFRQLFSRFTPGAGNDTLLLQLRGLRFSERSQQFGGTEAWGYVRASLYAGANGRWLPLSTLDTVLYVTKGDASRGVLRDVGKLLTAFVEAGRGATPSPPGYEWEQLAAIDSLEKAQMPLYTATALQEGAYYSYAALRDQQPDLKGVTLHFRGDKLKYVTARNGNRDELVESLYAVVAQGRLFVAGTNGYSEATREGDSFYYTGSVKLTARGEGVVAAQLAFGLVGVLVAGLPSQHTVRLKIDHRNGAPLLPDDVARSARAANPK